MNASLLKRLQAVESILCPAPPMEVKIFHNDETDEDVAQYRTEHPGCKIIRLVTVCGRRCIDGDGCDIDGGGLGCRQNDPKITPGWQPRQEVTE